MSAHRVPIPGGAVLLRGDLDLGDPARLFELERWDARAAPAGRGSTFFIRGDGHDWVLRQFRRGGLPGRFVRRRYLYTGEERVRAFREWRLLRHLEELGLPVPRPIAARYRRAAAWYTAELITARIEAATPLSRLLPGGPSAEGWRAVGRCVALFHARGVFHADLNAHNVLLGGDPSATPQVHLIDFDRGRLRPAGPWAEANLRRLRRSLDKLAPGEAGVSRGWELLREGYRAGPG